MINVPVTRLPLRLTADPSRVITRLFYPGDINRIRAIISRILEYPETQIVTLMAELERGFKGKHPDLRDVFSDHYDQVSDVIPAGVVVSRPRQLYIGACFTMEYAVEAVALFNPSIVPALHQEGIAPGSVRFVMSLRATGEGHMSSIVFRAGTIDRHGDIHLNAPPAYTRTLRAVLPDQFSKSSYRRDLTTMGVVDGDFKRILDHLGDHFNRDQLSEAINLVRNDQETSGFLEETADTLISLTRVNYQLMLEEPIPFLISKSRSSHSRTSSGMASRTCGWFVSRKTTGLGLTTEHSLHSMASAYFPQMLTFQGGQEIGVRLITGVCAKNKGMALFPRRIRGKYAMISRIDNENLFYMESDDLLFWDQVRSRFERRSSRGKSSRSATVVRRSRPTEAG